MCRWILFGFIAIAAFCRAETYDFRGVHYIATYSGCDCEALTNLDGLREAMAEAVRASGATILDSADYVFSPDAMTMVLLLSESHASIHTYPEHGACFIDLFTCGYNCSAEKFDASLRAYLQPHAVSQKTLIRHEGIEDRDAL
jgi:S-adenosylmethionine decarboxylase proenzyme